MECECYKLSVRPRIGDGGEGEDEVSSARIESEQHACDPRLGKQGSQARPLRAAHSGLLEAGATSGRRWDGLGGSQNVVADELGVGDESRDEVEQGLFWVGLGETENGLHGVQVHKRMLDIARRRHEAYQRRNLPPASRTKFNPRTVRLPKLKKDKLYLIGYVFMPRHIVKNFEHYSKIWTKDFAHLRHPANGSLGGYAMKNAAGHIEHPLLGMVLACEDASSWNLFDRTLLTAIPKADADDMAFVGDGQKGEVASHTMNFKRTLLRCCERHRGDDFRGSSATMLMAKRTYQAGVHCRNPATIVKALKALKRRNKWAFEKIMRVPLVRQFPACAIEAGYAPLRGETTSNLSEVSAVWPRFHASKSDSSGSE